jgi:phosphonate transport system ATP-binding protein
MTASAFKLKAVSCRFGDLVAIDDLSLRIEKNERLAVIGPSGSGKTTLLKTLNTIRAPEDGAVSVFDNDVAAFHASALRRLRSHIAFIPQHLGLVPNLSVIQNVILGKGGQRGTLRSLRDLLLPAKNDTLAIHEILERVGIDEKIFTRTDRLSGGQQQRVAIARALFQEPQIILADEPVSSVDPARARDTIKLLTDLSTEKNFTLCVSLQNADLAREFFPRLIGLRTGRIAFDTAPANIEEHQFDALYQLDADEMIENA